MSLGKIFFLSSLMFGSGAYAQQVTGDVETSVAEASPDSGAADSNSVKEPAITPENQTSVATIPADAKPLPQKFFRRELGIGYIQWNEIMHLQRGTASDSGFANYVGLLLNYDKNFYKYGGRWVNGYSVAGMIGKASSGLYSGSVNFDDGINRDWTGALIQAYSNYRFSPEFMLGLGLLARFRFIDWAPADTSVKITTPQPWQITGEVILRWTLNKRYTFIQSYAPMGFEGESQWIWTLQRGF